MRRSAQPEVEQNSVRLTAALAGIEPLRHTPAGMPVVEFTLTHASSQSEAGHQRTVEFEMSAKAVGSIAGKIAGMQLGQRVDVQGFLHRKHRMSRQVILHVTNIDLIE